MTEFGHGAARNPLADKARYVSFDTTICALSSAPGRAGIAVVRISGPQAAELARQVFISRDAPGSALPARRAVLGRIRDPRREQDLDEGLLTFFPAGASYTGEDVVELSLHGSPVLVEALLDTLCALGGQLAEPGEFTLRAFLHGRIDLAQAEAVRDVIEAKTLTQAQVAARQRSGELSQRLRPVKELLIDVVVQLESAVEFVEEDLDLDSRERTAAKLRQLVDDLDRWITSFRRGRLVREGFTLAIVGRPNVGKSSVFNALLSHERSIVADLPGTTRDLVSESTSIDGVPVRLLDTAGVRETGDRIERLGVDRSFQAIADADAVLLVVDGSEPRAPEDDGLRQRLAGLPALAVFNKADLPAAWSGAERDEFTGPTGCAVVSALTGEGIDALRKVIICHLLGEAPERDGVLVTNLRHARCLEASREALRRAAVALDSRLSEEFVLADLHEALCKLGEITGETTVEDLLGEIFSRFCIGK
jgi:tRNA modification GTPase